MKNINFSDEELLDLKSFYYEELDKINRRMNIIRGFLKKLDDVSTTESEPSINKPPKEKPIAKPMQSKKLKTENPVEVEKQAAASKPANKKPGRRPKKEQQSNISVKELREMITAKKAEALKVKKIAKNNRMKNDSLPITIVKAQKMEKTAKEIKVKTPKEVKVKTPKEVKVKALKEVKVKAPKEVKFKDPKVNTSAKPVKNITKKTTDAISEVKLGRKSKWGAFIFEILKAKQMPLTAAALTDLALKHFNLSGNNMEQTRIAVAGVLSKLSRHEKKLVPYAVKGVRGKSFCLPEWFDNKGKLKNTINSKILK